MRYPGGKGQAGTYQRIISLMPPHQVYIEPFLGGGAVLERKRPAPCSIGIDADAVVIDTWRARGWPDTVFHCADAVHFLRRHPFAVPTVVYVDPPYPLATRKSGPRYRHEFSDAQHCELLALLKTLPAFVLVSGYRCPLYDEALTGWHREQWRVRTRGGSWATETLWCNFDPPARLHDARFIGTDYRERERIRKRQARWRAGVAAMPPLEREAMLAWLRADYRERERIKKRQARWRRRLSSMSAVERAAMLALLLELAPPDTTVRSAPSYPAVAARAGIASSGGAHPARILSPELLMATSAPPELVLVDVEAVTCRGAAAAGESRPRDRAARAATRSVTPGGRRA